MHDPLGVHPIAATLFADALSSSQSNGVFLAATTPKTRKGGSELAYLRSRTSEASCPCFFLNSLFFFPCEDFLFFLSDVAFFSRDFMGLVEIEILVFLVGFLAFFQIRRESLMSVIFPPGFLGPEMAAPILWAPGIFCSFCLKTPMPEGGGGWNCQLLCAQGFFRIMKKRALRPPNARISRKGSICKHLRFSAKICVLGLPP